MWNLRVQHPAKGTYEKLTLHNVVNTGSHLISLKLARLQNDSSNLSSYLMENDLAKLKSVTQIQDSTIKTILLDKDVLFFLHEKWFKLCLYNPRCPRASNVTQQYFVGVSLQEHTFYFCLNFLFLNLISYAIRVENFFCSLPSPLKKECFFSVELVSVAVIILTAAGQWYSEQPGKIVPAARPDWGCSRVRFLSLIPTEIKLTLHQARK